MGIIKIFIWIFSNEISEFPHIKQLLRALTEININSCSMVQLNVIKLKMPSINIKKKILRKKMDQLKISRLI